MSCSIIHLLFLDIAAIVIVSIDGHDTEKRRLSSPKLWGYFCFANFAQHRHYKSRRNSLKLSFVHRSLVFFKATTDTDLKKLSFKRFNKEFNFSV